MTKLIDLISNKQYEQAIDLLTEMNTSNPNVETKIQLGIMECLNNQLKKGIITLESTLGELTKLSKKEKSEIYKHLGLAYLQINDKKKSNKYFKKQWPYTTKKFTCLTRMHFTSEKPITVINKKSSSEFFHKEKNFIIYNSNQYRTYISYQYWAEKILSLPPEFYLNSHNINILSWLNLLPNNINSSTKHYIFIQNPWERITDCYIYYFVLCKANTSFSSMFHKILDLNPYTPQKPNLSFKDFIHIIYTGFTELNNNIHVLLDTNLCPQTYGYESIDFDQIYTTDKLTDGLNDIISKHQLPSIPNHLLNSDQIIQTNSTTNVSEWTPSMFNKTNITNYKYFYTDDLINKVATIYKDDIDQFGFTYEN